LQEDAGLIAIFLDAVAGDVVVGEMDFGESVAVFNGDPERGDIFGRAPGFSRDDFAACGELGLRNCGCLDGLRSELRDG
jgi:hypothetical protein